jgi:hypothetical protein
MSYFARHMGAAVSYCVCACLPLHQTRALTTYIKRVYFPFMLCEPEVRLLGGFQTVLWAFSDPERAGTAAAAEKLGAATVVSALADLPAAVAAVAEATLTSGEPSIRRYLLTPCPAPVRNVFVLQLDWFLWLFGDQESCSKEAIVGR